MESLFSHSEGFHSPWGFPLVCVGQTKISCCMCDSHFGHFYFQLVSCFLKILLHTCVSWCFLVYIIIMII